MREKASACAEAAEESSAAASTPSSAPDSGVRATLFSAADFLALDGVLLTVVVFFLLGFLLVFGLALVLGSPMPAVFCCSRWCTTVGAPSTSGAAGVLAGGAVAVVVVVVAGVVVVASVVEVELVDDESPLLASGPGSAEVDVVVGVVAESAALAVVFTASAEPVSGPAMPAARAESTARRIRLRAVITPAIPTLRSSRTSLLRPWAEAAELGTKDPLGGGDPPRHTDTSVISD